MRRVNNVLIGKDIARTEDLDITATSSQNLAEGEVFVTDEHGSLLSSGSTISDASKIYIGVGTGETYDVTQPDGTEVTGLRKIKWSSPINGRHVKRFNGLEGDSSATERKATIDLESASSFSPTEGEEYVIRVVYTDVEVHPGQFAQDFRVISSDGTTATLVDDFVKRINNTKPSRVTASEDGSDDLVITGKAVADDNKDAIDEYHQVNFEVFLTSKNFDDVDITYDTQAHPGNGNPLLVRDKEKHAQGYEGITNRTHFPVVKPELDVDVDTWYDTIVIEHMAPYIAADNQYEKTQPLTTEIYIPTGADQTSTAPTSGHDAVLNVLNPWMASLPGDFNNVSV